MPKSFRHRGLQGYKQPQQTWWLQLLSIETASTFLTIMFSRQYFSSQLQATIPDAIFLLLPASFLGLQDHYAPTYCVCHQHAASFPFNIHHIGCFIGCFINKLHISLSWHKHLPRLHLLLVFFLVTTLLYNNLGQTLLLDHLYLYLVRSLFDAQANCHSMKPSISL